MLAQASKQVPQGVSDISDTVGVGKFGFSPEQLEKTGFLKPGTTEFFLKDATANISTVLGSSSVWTGNQGVSGLSDFLGNESLQDFAQTDLFNKGLSELQSLGVATGLEDTGALAGLVAGAAKFGGEAVAKWTQGAGVLGETVAGNASSKISKGQMDELVRGGQYAVELAIQKLPEAVQGFNTAVNSATNTSLRTNVDSAVKSVVASPKVPGHSGLR